MDQARRVTPAVRRVALLPWGDLIEDFLAELDMRFADFRDEMTGGWLFGYVEALRRAGIETTIVCVSAEVEAVARWTHRPTGAAICVLPAPRPFRVLRRRMRRPLSASAEETFPDLRPAVARALKDVASYLATPPRLLARTLRDERCDAIFCQEYESPRFDVCVAVGRTLGLPVFGVFQGGDFQVSRWEHRIRPLTMRAATGVIVGADGEAARVQHRYVGVPVARIVNPLDTAAWCAGDRAAARAELGWPDGVRIVAWHGRVDVQRKGLDVLLDAWELVVRARPGRALRLELIGSGGDAEAFRALLAARQLPTVGWVDRYLRDPAAIRRRLSAADVWVMPSRHEGFPVALLEAMACGLPVVATAVPGVDAVLAGGERDGGLVVEPGRADALADALGRLVDDEALARTLGERARARVDSAFSLDAVGQRLAALLERRP